MSDPETAANTLICLINQATCLLARQLQQLEQASEVGAFYRH
jgi:four helix bundle suffix protein